MSATNAGTHAATQPNPSNKARQTRTAPKRPAHPRPAWQANVPPAPIRGAAAHRAALAELMRLGRLMDTGEATPAEADTAHVLKLLVVDYEKAKYGAMGAIRTMGAMGDSPDAPDTPVGRLRYLMEQSGMSPSDLGRLLGDRPLGFRVLSGQRALSKIHIRKLAAHFKLDAGYFL